MAKLEEVYPKLPDSRSIRVIELYGTEDPNEMIRFNYSIVSLDAVTPYQAISYTWSGQPLDRPAYANNRIYKITKNAEDIMRRLRPNKRRKSINLWIDAICIDQQDDEEKSTQVELMLEIYANAQRVNIWLGHGTKPAAFALKCQSWVFWSSFLLPFVIGGGGLIKWTVSPLAILLLSAPALCLVFFLLVVVESTFLITFGMLPIFKAFKRELRAGLVDLASMEYWERAWTIQEVCTNHWCYVLCGTSRPRYLPGYFLSKNIIRMTYYLFDRCTPSVIPMENLIRVYDLHERKKPSDLQGEVFDHTILDVLCTKKATIARDKLFAIKAMFPQSLGRLKTDYTVSDACVYTEAAWIVLETSQKAEFLRYACHDRQDDSFPMWVPAWRAPTNIPEWLYKCSPAALAPNAIASRDNSSNGVLKLKGRRVDQVTAAISKRFPIIKTNNTPTNLSRLVDLDLAAEALTVLRAWIIATGAESNNDPHFFQLALLLSQIGVKLVLHNVNWLLRVQYENDVGVDSFWTAFVMLLKHHTGYDARRLMVNFLRIISSRWLFAAESGRVGMSSLEVHEGDEVALFTGERLPYVIRKSPEHPGKYTLVAPCWMSGEIKGKQWPGWSGLVEDLEDIELV